MPHKEVSWAELGAWKGTSCAELVKVKQLQKEERKKEIEKIFSAHYDCFVQRLHWFCGTVGR